MFIWTPFPCRASGCSLCMSGSCSFSHGSVNQINPVSLARLNKLYKPHEPPDLLSYSAPRISWQRLLDIALTSCCKCSHHCNAPSDYICAKTVSPRRSPVLSASSMAIPGYMWPTQATARKQKPTVGPRKPAKAPLLAVATAPASALRSCLRRTPPTVPRTVAFDREVELRYTPYMVVQPSLPATITWWAPDKDVRRAIVKHMAKGGES